MSNSRRITDQAALFNKFGAPDIVAANGHKFSHLRFNSPREAHITCAEYGRHSGAFEDDSKWNGLESIRFPEFDSTGLAPHITARVQSAVANMPENKSKPGTIRPAVVGAIYSIPDLMAGVPTPARIRTRTKLAPISIRLAVSFSWTITNEQMAPLCARLARAIWNYTQSGGVVTLTTYFMGGYRTPNNKGHKGGIIETRVNAADIQGIALALSPTFGRAIAWPMVSTLSGEHGDGLPIIRSTPLGTAPDLYYVTGTTGEGVKALEAVLARMEIV